jgi:hypothetical protein
MSLMPSSDRSRNCDARTEQSVVCELGIDRCSLMTPLRESWKLQEGRLEELVDFAGGLATIFPRTATVESDFSVIGWEKDIYRSALTDFSLEGLLHARQFDRLRRLYLYQHSLTSPLVFICKRSRKRNCNAFPEVSNLDPPNAPENSSFRDFRTYPKITRSVHCTFSEVQNGPKGLAGVGWRTIR